VLYAVHVRQLAARYNLLNRPMRDPHVLVEWQRRLGDHSRYADYGEEALGSPAAKLTLRSAACGRLMRDAHPTHLFGVILAIEYVPFLTALENLLLLRADFLADLGVHLLLFFEQAQQDFHHILSDGGAIFDEFDILPGNQDVGNDVGQADGFFPAQSHKIA